MQKESLEFLKQLVDTPSPSGYEARVQDVIRGRLQTCCDKVTTDVHGNVIGITNEAAPFRVMLAGHCDEIGFMLVHIDAEGFAYFSSVGGIDPAVVIGQRVIVHGTKGPVQGVIGRKAIHLMDRDEKPKPPKIHDLWMDIGASSRKDAEKVISVGDYATLDAGFREMRNGLAVARGFDDRAGAFVVAEAMRRLRGMKLAVAVYGVSSVQEEIGLRGARTSAYGIDPNMGIAVDVGHATDYPGGEPKKTGECRLGKGPVLHRGPNINPVLEKLLVDVARRKRIPFQITAEPGATGTDANAIQVTRAGVAAALVSVPNRYMHSSVEMVSLEDLDNASKLLAEVVASLKRDTDFVPRSGR